MPGSKNSKKGQRNPSLPGGGGLDNEGVSANLCRSKSRRAAQVAGKGGRGVL